MESWVNRYKHIQGARRVEKKGEEKNGFTQANVWMFLWTGGRDGTGLKKQVKMEYRALLICYKWSSVKVYNLSHKLIH